MKLDLMAKKNLINDNILKCEINCQKSHTTNDVK